MALTTRRLLTIDDLDETPDDGNRYEIIAGELIVSSAPVPIHQEVAGTLFASFRDAVRGRELGKVYFAPVDVRLSKHNVVEPDLVYVSRERRHIVGPKFIDGAPDLLVEILSPSTLKRDREAKMRLYERFGVLEYWMVDPIARTVVAVALVDGRYEPLPEVGGVIRSTVIPGLAIEVAALFVDLW
jgi:Uma2 family endonuclease